MGWSCNKAAGDTLNAISKGCVKHGGDKSQNMWTDGDTRYFFERSNVEHDDGAITGSIHKILRDDNDKCHKVGSFRIDPDGTINHAPSKMKLFFELGQDPGPVLDAILSAITE